jgi:transcriptional regulator with XRE-family HTH domain
VTVATEANPTLARRELSVYFRTLREQHGYSVGRLAEVLKVAQSQASRLDTGARNFRDQDVRELCRLYDLGVDERNRLLAIAEESRMRAWWQQVELLDSYRTLIGLEQGALVINEFCAGAIPGLLQTRSYAEAAARDSQMGVQAADIQRAIDVRMRRQRLLERAKPPEMSFIVDEAALARGAGTADTMQEQLQHLLDLSRRSEITIQIIGFEEGVYPGHVGQFILLRMSRNLPDVYYTEDQLNTSDTTDVNDVRAARRLWELLQARALSPRKSADRIAEYRDRLHR